MRLNRTWRDIALWTCAVLLLFALAPEALAGKPTPCAERLGPCHGPWTDANHGSPRAKLAHLKGASVVECCACGRSLVSAIRQKSVAKPSRASARKENSETKLKISGCA